MASRLKSLGYRMITQGGMIINIFLYIVIRKNTPATGWVTHLLRASKTDGKTLTGYPCTKWSPKRRGNPRHHIDCIFDMARRGQPLIVALSVFSMRRYSSCRDIQRGKKRTALHHHVERIFEVERSTRAVTFLMGKF
jgi:hypothetical protein